MNFLLRTMFSVLVAALCIASVAHAAEARLAVAPRISLPAGTPTYTEELMNFFGNNISVLTGSYLKARVEKNHGQEIPAAVLKSLRVEVNLLPKTSILEIKCSGADETVCQRYLMALTHEFLAYKVEGKKRHYDEAIQRVELAIKNAKDDLELAKSLTNYRDQLVVASRLDTVSDFELLPVP